jgi:hypothetical protein
MTIIICRQAGRQTNEAWCRCCLCSSFSSSALCLFLHTYVTQVANGHEAHKRGKRVKRRTHTHTLQEVIEARKGGRRRVVWSSGTHGSATAAVATWSRSSSSTRRGLGYTHTERVPRTEGRKEGRDKTRTINQQFESMLVARIYLLNYSIKVVLQRNCWDCSLFCLVSFHS